MLTFDRLVEFVKYHNTNYKKAKERRKLNKELEDIEKKVAEMMRSFNSGLKHLDEADQKAIRHMLASSTKDMLSTFLSFMKHECHLNIPDWH